MSSMMKKEGALEDGGSEVGVEGEKRARGGLCARSCGSQIQQTSRQRQIKTSTNEESICGYACPHPECRYSTLLTSLQNLIGERMKNKTPTVATTVAAPLPSCRSMQFKMNIELRVVI